MAQLKVSSCPKSLDPEVSCHEHVKLGVSSAGLHRPHRASFISTQSLSLL